MWVLFFFIDTIHFRFQDAPACCRVKTFTGKNIVLPKGTATAAFRWHRRRQKPHRERRKQISSSYFDCQRSINFMKCHFFFSSIPRCKCSGCPESFAWRENRNNTAAAAWQEMTSHWCRFRLVSNPPRFRSVPERK